ncbi:hypothetical protein B0T20DRAFT_456843 [Sordaria brevicollis]|uniref:C2H2-type domain-containing protein n=1 Tax=Sordaria brevicollis TaxID=83679 RepID=A0AAE0NWG0_SORBR|nr:hypothetical protein B0T20DRAFT_456843 [Sordaria brevicollis]
MDTAYPRASSTNSLAAARLHIDALTKSGISRDELLSAILEGYNKASSEGVPSTMMTHNTSSLFTTREQHTSTMNDMSRHNSVSTTSSGSSGRAASILSVATTTSSVSSQNMYDSSTATTSPSLKAALSVPGGSLSKTSNRGASKPQGPYWCTFCNVSFQRKFDWKRHEDEFHERHKRYPCPDCNSVFWGANTFNQHHKNAHGCTTCPHAEQVVRYTQRRTAWACGFCGAFMGARDRYFDHVARHYEDGCNKSHWNHSLVIYGLLHQPVVSQAWKELFARMYGHLIRDHQPILGWDAQATGHAQGFLEGEAPGKLQDLLEFFKGGREEAKRLARLSHDQAIIRSRQGVAITAIRVPVPKPSVESLRPRSKQSTASTESLRHKSILQHHQQHLRTPHIRRKTTIPRPPPSTLNLTQFPLPPTNKYSHLHSHNLKFSLPVETIYETPEAVTFFETTLAATTNMTASSKQLLQQDQNQNQDQIQNQFMIPPLSLPAESLLDKFELDFGTDYGGGDDWSSITSTVVMNAGVGGDDGASGFSVPGVLTASGSGSSVRDVRW